MIISITVLFAQHCHREFAEFAILPQQGDCLKVGSRICKVAAVIRTTGEAVEAEIIVKPLRANLEITTLFLVALGFASIDVALGDLSIDQIASSDTFFGNFMMSDAFSREVQS